MTTVDTSSSPADRHRVADAPCSRLSRSAGYQGAIGSFASLYAHALAIETEAIARYREFARHAADHDNEPIAELFNRLADFGCEHSFRLTKRALGMVLPGIDAGTYAWLDSGAPCPEARDFVFRMMTQRHALEIALEAEKRAKRFFDFIERETDDPGVRKLAAEFAQEKGTHVLWVQAALERLPGTFRPGSELPGEFAKSDEI